jgi:hypothetical protein
MKKQKFMMLFAFVALLGLWACEEDTVDPTANPRDQFTGTWVCKDQPTKNGLATYTVTISADPNNEDQVIVKNYFQLGSDALPYAIVSGTSIEIPSQLTCSDNSWTVSAHGTLTKSTEIQWDVYDANDLSYTATFTKQ